MFGLFPHCQYTFRRCGWYAIKWRKTEVPSAMVDINDPEGLRKRFNRQLRLLEEAATVDEDNKEGITPISKEDSNTILAFIDWIQANRNNKPQSNANHLKHLRLTAQRCDGHLVEMDERTLNAFTTSMGSRVKDKTINNYKGSWKPFFTYLEKPWADDIEFYKINDDDDDGIEEWKIFSEDEISKMIEIADSRITAAIALLTDTGCRIGALCSIYRGDIKLDGDVAIIILNPDAPTKDADGHVPLTWSRSYLVNYLQGDHPRPDRDDVALIHKRQRYDGETGAVSPTHLREEIQAVMKEAGIEQKKRRKPHHFRHTAVTNWVKMGIPKDVIQHRTKWADMSMLERYSHLFQEDKDRMTAVAYGLIDSAEDESTLSPDDVIGECPVCGTRIRLASDYCPGCGNPIVPDAAHDHSPSGVQEPEKTGQDLSELDGVFDQMAPAAVLEQLIKKNPELLKDLDLD
jgi:integrase/recombinase XerD